MIVGGEEYVEAGILDGIKEFVGCTEGRVTPVRFSS
jgi:hypothetical protein